MIQVKFFSGTTRSLQDDVNAWINQQMNNTCKDGKKFRIDHTNQTQNSGIVIMLAISIWYEIT